MKILRYHPVHLNGVIFIKLLFFMGTYIIVPENCSALLSLVRAWKKRFVASTHLSKRARRYSRMLFIKKYKLYYEMETNNFIGSRRLLKIQYFSAHYKLYTEQRPTDARRFTETRACNPAINMKSRYLWDSRLKSRGISV